MTRWRILAVALVFLLSQGAALLHVEDAAEDCGECAFGGPALECSGEDCADPGHHHHRHHDPATCRSCASDHQALAQSAPAPAAPAPAGILDETPALDHESVERLVHAARAPPGSLRTPA